MLFHVSESIGANKHATALQQNLHRQEIWNVDHLLLQCWIR